MSHDPEFVGLIAGGCWALFFFFLFLLFNGSVPNQILQRGAAQLVISKILTMLLLPGPGSVLFGQTANAEKMFVFYL